MKTSPLVSFVGWSVVALAVGTLVMAAPEPARTLDDERKALAAEAVKNGRAAIAADGWIELRATHRTRAAELSLRAPAAGWNLGATAELAVPVRNLGAQATRVVLHVDDGRSLERERNPLRRGVRAEMALPPDGRVMWLVVPLAGAARSASTPPSFISLVGEPHEFVRLGVVIGEDVRGVRIVLPNPAALPAVAVGPLTARGVPAPLSAFPPTRVFPLVDEYGQYRHRDWPGKIARDADLAERRKDEERDLAAQTRPREWDQYGGWAAGPKRQATGFFRAEKIDGTWWLVDPEGHLFWSHGVVRVGTRIRVGGIYRGTPLPDRERYFTLPPDGSPLAAFFGTEPEGTRGHYVGRPNHRVYDYLEANLHRKFGADWSEAYAVEAQRRLASWGLNTIANSSDPAVYCKRQTPYTAIIYSAPMGFSEHRLAGSAGNWGKLPDPFDPGWHASMRERLAVELKDAANDPWCLGFFVDNELNWGDTVYLAEATIASPASQPAKRAFVATLQKKYSDIAALNTAWGTSHHDWNAWLENVSPPDRKRATVRADLEGFSEQYLEAYFAGCRSAIKAHAPGHMYLGCRFAQGANAIVMRVAVRHCEIISINRYATLVDDVTLPAGLDRPILIGEFHFGALDRGPLANALVPVPDQPSRAIAYRLYVESALRNPRIVGTHWFQYFDQPTTGRFDGENYQTGLVDICDTPYPETIAAVRSVAASLYATRAQATSGAR